MSRPTITPEELGRRNQLSTRYKNVQRRTAIDEEVRGIRTAINILIKREQELLREAKGGEA